MRRFLSLARKYPSPHFPLPSYSCCCGVSIPLQGTGFAAEALTLLPTETQDPRGRASNTERIRKPGNQSIGRRFAFQPFLLENRLGMCLRRCPATFLHSPWSSPAPQAPLRHSPRCTQSGSILLLSSQRKQPCPRQEVPKAQEDGLSLFPVATARRRGRGSTVLTPWKSTKGGS